MLIIERKISQGVYVGEAYIKILPGSTHGRVRLGIEAPRAVSIMREELVAPPSDNHPVIPGPWPKVA